MAPLLARRERQQHWKLEPRTAGLRRFFALPRSAPNRTA
jgi:hypothetical protein